VGPGHTNRKEPEVVLRSDRRTAPRTAEHRAPGAAPGYTAADIGRLLARERTRQGLSLPDVGLRTGIPLDQLRAAETGVLDRPDGLATLKTVRRYADFLGLPGDRFALAILEHWPTKGGPHPLASAGALAPTAGHAPLTGPTATVPVLGPLTVPVPKTGTGGTDRRGVGGSPAARISPPPDDGARWDAYSETGVTPAVPAPAGQVRRRSRRAAPVALRGLVVVVAVAVAVGLALLALDKLKPSWLRTVGILQHEAPSAQVGAPRSALPVRPATASPSRSLHPHVTAGGTTFVVHAGTFDATVSAATGPCWVEVRTNTSPTPAYAGVIQPGGSQRFPHVRALVVQMGSTAGRLSITSSAGHVATYSPKGAPYTISVRTSR